MKNQVSKKRKIYIALMRILMAICTVSTCALVLFLVIYVLVKGIPNISWKLLSESPSYLTGEIGILPDILNTIYIILATLVIVIPLGAGAATKLVLAKDRIERIENVKDIRNYLERIDEMIERKRAGLREWLG